MGDATYAKTTIANTMIGGTYSKEEILRRIDELRNKGNLRKQSSYASYEQ